MKYLLNALLAFFFVWIYLSVIQEHVESEAIKEAAFFIPGHMQIIFWWVIFSFPSYVGSMLRLIGDSIFSMLTYGLQTGGHLLEYITRNRAGKVALGCIIAYVLYAFFDNPLNP